jgi:hypothetical protein
MKLKVAFSTLILLSFAVMLILPLEAPAQAKRAGNNDISTLAQTLSGIKAGNVAAGGEINVEAEFLGNFPWCKYWPVVILNHYVDKDDDGIADDCIECDDCTPGSGEDFCIVLKICTWFGAPEGKVPHYWLVFWGPRLGGPEGTTGIMLFPGGNTVSESIIPGPLYWMKKLDKPGVWLLKACFNKPPCQWKGDYQLIGNHLIQTEYNSLSLGIPYQWAILHWFGAKAFSIRDSCP